MSPSPEVTVHVEVPAYAFFEVVDVGTVLVAVVAVIGLGLTAWVVSRWARSSRTNTHRR